MKNETSELSDADLVKYILESRDTNSFEIIYDRYSTKVFNKCLSFVKRRSIAEDLSHDIFLKVYLNLSKFSGRSSFSTWLYAITYNYCVDFVNKGSRRQQEITDYGKEQEFGDRTSEDIMGLQADRLAKIMDELPIEDKMLLLMKYQDDVSIKDLTEALDVSESAIKMRLKRARERAMNMYKETYRHNTY